MFLLKRSLVIYLLTWFLLFIAAFVNGTIREFVYKPYVGELAAHQISTFTLILLITLVVWLIYRKHPLENYTQCVIVGLMWMTMTAAWEFIFGHYAMGHSWEKLLYDYNLREGRIWVFIVIWMGWVTAFVRWMEMR